uniref:Uncharacterized protein n=1 Tax=Lactuca sativa TaxID=4236 RepID=A0A9R1VHT9_LACSA|nr:hypothetical protein LSAT_V11C500292940 [Lactuca sativa]
MSFLQSLYLISKKSGKKCKYWEWIDEPVTRNPDLEQELEAIKDDVACLKKEVQELKNKAHSFIAVTPRLSRFTDTWLTGSTRQVGSIHIDTRQLVYTSLHKDLHSHALDSHARSLEWQTLDSHGHALESKDLD